MTLAFLLSSVEFLQEEDRVWMKKKLVEQHKQQLGNYLFDGASLFTPQRYCPPGAELALTSQREDVGSNR